MSVTTTYDEASVLQQIAAGDESAFSAFFHHWQPYLATHIYRITESAHLAEEVVQDVFMKIWMTRETLSSVTYIKAYLLTLSRNEALNALKSMMRRLSHEATTENLPPFEAEEPEQHRAFQLTLIDEAIDQLPARQKEVFLLHRHQRLTYAEIAEKLNIGKESVKTHLQLATKAITSHVKGRITVLILLLELQDKNFF
ncbi:RNA polymerase sigma-70 factor, ECF subfamily [Chitinophaga jiangningensis]|uniref:RNA polymerase sigma-70 factor, ECF subfamily n=1 Tax=Chitinophaga jiangningensis TaxID=1419482 RepID=A0A1M6Y5X6_9BACT|nr:sigma-70 family RNA polymerase sigma factor [Chitinophaga jiangningensis]SHL13385.1 RNA polymerase sigma-70 factor, ECF subfamily [Chitinophaga jiangningensis]